MDFKKEIQNSKELESKALEECNNEPIETPEFIQSYGALLGFDFDSLAITYASNNIEEYFDIPIQDVFNYSIRDFFKKEDFHAIANVSSHKSAYNHREQVKVILIHGKENDLSLFRVDQQVILEITPVIGPSSVLQINSHLKWTLDAIRKFETVDEILVQSVNALKNITKFDRVKALKFHPDNSGEIVAEVNNGKMDTYLGMRFPSYDIPTIARKLLLKNPIRHVHNTSDKGIPIRAANKTLPSLNISLGILRGNSPIHSQYLRNMGVVSALTIPIIIKGALWGLFSLHNQSEKVLTSEITYSAELIGQLVSMILEQKIQQHAEEKIKRLYIEGEEFITLNQSATYLQSFWKTYARKLKKLIPCDGVAYQIDEKIMTYENCPDDKVITELSITFDTMEDMELYHTTNISDLGFKNSGVSKGMLAMKINNDAPKIYIYFFRNEIEQKITWAGNPKKDIYVEKEKVRLHPRSSFNHFNELNKGQSENWDSETLTLAEIALETFKKAVQIERATTERLKIVVQELNHRLRNILTLVRSISKQTAENDTSIEEYVNSLEHRILALSKANNLLTLNSYNAVDLKTLFLKIILPLCSNKEHIILKGSKVKLSSDIVPMMVLIIHELTTNALKYGSLSVKKGILTVEWTFTQKNDLLIKWKETKGPEVKRPSKNGFGTTIIANAISYEFGGTSKILFEEDGLHAELRIPEKLIGENFENVFVSEQVQEAKISEQKIKKTDQPKTSKKISILILEDDFINAQDIKNIISDLKVDHIDTFSNQKDALVSLKTTTYSLALLDVNLKNETCIEVALACKLQQIPFYYITGYGASFLKENPFPEAPIILKPIQTQKLETIVNHYIRK